MDLKTRIAIRSAIIFTLIVGVYVFQITKPRGQEVRPVVLGSDITEQVFAERERVECQFDKPIGIIVGVMHYYDSYEALNITYQNAGDMDPDEEVWGWSFCEWQPEHNYAACDIHTVLPEFVESNVMDTIGHEFWHGACGYFHE